MDKHLIGPLLELGFLRGLSWDPYFFDIHKRYSEKYWLFYTVVRRRYKSVHNCKVCRVAANLINIDLDTISTWAANWLVNFHERYTFSMILSRKLLPHSIQRIMNTIMLPETDSHKHLGLILSKSCTWSNHIQEIASKAWYE